MKRRLAALWVLVAATALGQPTSSHQAIVSTGATNYGWVALPNCAGNDKALNYTTASGAFSCATVVGGGSLDCISIPLWSAVAQVGNTVTTTSCTTMTNLSAVANRGHQVFIDMDRYTHAKLIYFGALAGGGQSGAVTVNLRDIGAGTDSITTSFNSGTGCVDRSSATTDLSAKSGLVQFTARIGDATTTDDPLLSTVSVQFCNGSF